MMGKKRKRDSGCGRRGGSLLEFALFAPVVLYLLLAVGDFGRYYIEASRVDEAAALAARRAAAGENVPRNVQAASVKVEVETFCGCPAEPEVRFACGERSCGSYGEPARYVQASVESPFSFLSRYPGFPAPLAIRRKAAVRVR